jgi:hypothetical protein
VITVHDEVIQGSHEWDHLRAGLYTGSNAHKLLKYGAIEYARTETSTFKGNYYTKRGHLLEDEAIELYEAIKKVKVPRPGFITNDEFPDCGFSPDGFPDEPIIECKAFNEKKHLSIYNGDIPLEVMAQIQFGLMICERPLAHLLIYNPELEPKLAFKIIEIKYNPKVGNNFKRILKGQNKNGNNRINARHPVGAGARVGSRSRNISTKPNMEREGE